MRINIKVFTAWIVKICNNNNNNNKNSFDGMHYIETIYYLKNEVKIHSVKMVGPSTSQHKGNNVGIYNT